MDFFKKFLFILLFIFLWDIISHIIDNDFIVDFNNLYILNYLLKTFVIFTIFLILDKLLKKRKES